ncbi:hypothetical protein SO802_001802 [Lithocarpus litseifolius]|uniref:Transcription initiation factor IIB n=1 Tax=Lithocarpus litseifolius TaxID=425828 RepID=A0AAW2DVQ6_9ROSI
MTDGFCTDCKAWTPVVFDHTAGDTICSERGLVLESRSIYETSEWRTFADESRDKDSNRVGASSDPLLCGSLMETIKNHAKELYKKVTDQNVCRGRNLSPIMAACLYYDCQEEGFPRTMKEIAMVTKGAIMKDIYRAKRLVREKLEIGNKVIHAGDLARRYCSHLGLNNLVTKAVLETVKKSEKFDIRRTSTSILATIIYMITQLSGWNSEVLSSRGVTLNIATPNLFIHSS